MIGSVYDPGRGRYRYYRLRIAPGQPWTQPGSSIGTGVEDALPPLPLGSVPAGEGENAIGPILNPTRSLRPYVKYLGLGLLGLVAWRAVRG
jgi:hypothetical protein